MAELSEMTCTACRGDMPALKGQEVQNLLSQLEGWEVRNEHHITKSYTFPDFRSAMDFVNRVGELAEEQRHHPMIHLTWGMVAVDIWTHKVNGLTENDFILAARIDKLPRQ